MTFIFRLNQMSAKWQIVYVADALPSQQRSHLIAGRSGNFNRVL